MSFGFGMGFTRNDPFAGGPSLNLQFVGNTVLDPSITFTRALNTATYFNSAGLLTTADANVPRFDYDPVTLAPRGLLIEEQRTNLLTYSEQFDNASWNKGTGGSIAANSVVSPDGTSNADAYTWSSSTASFAFLSQSVSAASNVANTFSIWLKRPSGSGSRTIRLSVSDVITSTANSSTFTVTESWQRFNFTRTSAASTGQVGVGLAAGLSGTPIASGEVLEVWGAQLEAGAFATSYIPTVASQVTRNADVASVNTLSPWYNQTQGTLYAEFTPKGPSPVTGNARILEFNNGTVSTRALIYSTPPATNGIAFQIRDAGVDQVALSFASTYAVNTTVKVAAAMQANNFAMTVNAATPSTDITGTLPSFSEFNIAAVRSGPTEPFNGWLRRITYYPRRLSNAELQAITS